MKKNHLALCVIFLLLAFNSCKKAQNSAPINPGKSDNSVLSYVKSLGFRDTEIKDLGKDYLVDGDILFSKSAVLKNDTTSSSKIKTNQYGGQTYLGLNTNVIIRVDPSMNSYIGEIDSAIAEWNNVPNCRVNFSRYTGTGSYNTTITNTALQGGAGVTVCGAAYYPLNGQPGNLVMINVSAISSLPFNQRKRTITHELGHSIGLAHTNWYYAYDPPTGTTGNGAPYTITHIFGTPTTYDFNSLMNSGECGIGATVLSAFDKTAVQFLYPENPPVPGAIPIYRYFSKNASNHFYTANFSELGAGKIGYIFEGVGFFAFPTQVPGTVPIYMYWNSTIQNHYYTPSSTTPAGYVYDRIAFYAYQSALNGSLPIYEYYYNGYGTIRSDHFYTKDQNEFFMGNTIGYVLTGPVFYGY